MKQKKERREQNAGRPLLYLGRHHLPAASPTRRQQQARSAQAEKYQTRRLGDHKGNMEHLNTPTPGRFVCNGHSQRCPLAVTSIRLNDALVSREGDTRPPDGTDSDSTVLGLGIYPTHNSRRKSIRTTPRRPYPNVTSRRSELACCAKKKRPAAFLMNAAGRGNSADFLRPALSAATSCQQ